MARQQAPNPDRKIIARNRRAFRDYHISDRFEAGMSLVGSEVKSLREGRASLSDGYAEITAGEIFLVNCHIAEYPQATHYNHEPRRKRKLLMHAGEIRRLTTKLHERGYTLVPIEMYFIRGKAKIELGLAKGKRLYDKRDAVRQRDQQRDDEAAMRKRY